MQKKFLSDHDHKAHSRAKSLIPWATFWGTFEAWIEPYVANQSCLNAPSQVFQQGALCKRPDVHLLLNCTNHTDYED